MDHASGAGAARSTWLGTRPVATAMRCGAARSHAMISPLLRCGSRGLRERGPPASVIGVVCFRTTSFIPRCPPDANPKHIPQPAPAQSRHSRHTCGRIYLTHSIKQAMTRFMSYRCNNPQHQTKAGAPNATTGPVLPAICAIARSPLQFTQADVNSAAPAPFHRLVHHDAPRPRLFRNSPIALTNRRNP